ncbi:hypothetical protein D3C85_1774420 [compost metagenome]
MLQLGDNDKTDDYEQEPGTDFTEMDNLPGMLLIRITPGPEQGRYVLGHPDEESDQQKRDNERHP